MMTSRRSCLRLVALLACAFHAHAFATGGVYVVVSAQSDVRELAKKDVLALYTGHTRVFPNGEAAVPLDQDRDGQVRASFYQALTGMDIARINSYWARLHFTGQVQPPQVAGDDDAAVIARLRADPRAIGYLVDEPKGAGVRVVLRLP